MSNPSELFSLPPIVLTKVSLIEILTELRKRVNKHYMPSATGEVCYNSKPEYVKSKDSAFPHFPSYQVMDNYGSGYYVLMDEWGWSDEKAPVFFHLAIGGFQIVINLTTEEALIRLLETNAPFVPWNNSPEQTIPIIRDTLKDIIDTYG